MERASGAVLGEGGSEVDLRAGCSPATKKIASCFPERKAKDRAFLPRRELADRRPYSNTEETPWRGGASLSGEKLHRSLAALRMTAV